MTLSRVVSVGFCSRCFKALSSSPSLSLSQRAGRLLIVTTLPPLGLFVAKRGFSAVNCQQQQQRNMDSSPAADVGSRMLYYHQVGLRSDDQRRRRRYAIVAFALWLFRAVKICVRLVQLVLLYAPLLIAYPIIVHWAPDGRWMTRWYAWAVYLVERSGPAIIKFAQWATTRRDLFSKEFCDVFSRFHTSVAPHGWKRTAQAMEKVLGPDWRDYFMEFREECCGSGCVAQVHKARLNYVAIHRAPETIRKQFDNYDRPCVDVAVKVVHPGLRSALEDDLAILSGLATIVQWILPSTRYADPNKCVHEFRDVLYRQIDLRYEGDALRVFTEQFQNDASIHFPRPLLQTPDILIETFEDGEHISKYLMMDDAVDLKRKLASMGMEALLKMVFVNNFVHGDLHPGNILVQNYQCAKQRNGVLKKLGASVWRLVGKNGSDLSYDSSASDGVVVETECRTRLVFLDAGISFRLSERDLKNLRAVFKAVVKGDGAEAGELMLKHAPQERCQDRAAFMREVESIVRKARSATVSLGTMDVSSLLSDLLGTVSRHRVNLEPNYSCVILAVLVLEGLGRSLYPQLDLLEESRAVLTRV